MKVEFLLLALAFYCVSSTNGEENGSDQDKIPKRGNSGGDRRMGPADISGGPSYREWYNGMPPQQGGSGNGQQGSFGNRQSARNDANGGSGGCSNTNNGNARGGFNRRNNMDQEQTQRKSAGGTGNLGVQETNKHGKHTKSPAAVL